MVINAELRKRLLAELDPALPDIAYGLCDLGMGSPELGSASIVELQAIRGPGGQLDASSCSQILFMDRDDILDLYVVNSIPLPKALLPRPASTALTDDIPF